MTTSMHSRTLSFYVRALSTNLFHVTFSVPLGYQQCFMILKVAAD